MDENLLFGVKVTTTMRFSKMLDALIKEIAADERYKDIPAETIAADVLAGVDHGLKHFVREENIVNYLNVQRGTK